MPKSRYSGASIVDGKSYGTFSLPVRGAGFKNLNLLENVQCIDYTIKARDRADHIAAKYYNEDSYWWVICLVNQIDYPFASGGWVPGRIIKIPTDVKQVFEKLFK